MAIVRVSRRQQTCSVLCLDKDGLLFDRDSFWLALWVARVKELANLLGSEGIELLRGLMGVTRYGIIDPHGPFALAYPKDEISVAAAVLYQQAHLPWDDALGKVTEAFQAADANPDLQQALKPRQGFPRILQRAKDAGLRVAIVTSDDRDRAQASLELFGVSDLVDLICTPGDVEHGKPHRDMLDYVANVFQAATSELCMVGDSLVDVEMAKSAGSLGVAIPYPDTKHLFGGYTVVSSLDDICF